MSREIIFRGRTEKGEWVEGDLLRFNNLAMCVIWNSNSGTAVIPQTVGQYTGVSDKNGKKIFEGDIIQTKMKSRKEEKVFRFVVKYGAYIPEEYCREIYRQWEVIGFYAFDGKREYQLSNCPKQLEIIGNIHDTPELLN